MTTYRVERMTNKNYGAYMMGSNNYKVETIEVIAYDVDDAIRQAQTDGYVVNKNYVKTVEELEAIKRAKHEARIKEEAIEEVKRATATAKRNATEQKKAEEAGMTLQEYRADRWRKGEIRRLEKIIAEAEAELKKLRG